MKARNTSWAQQATRNWSEGRDARGYQPSPEEAARLEAVRQAGTAPDGCGPEIVRVAPARGAAVAFVPSQVVPVGTDGVEVVARGYKGRSALRVADVFDRINAAIARRGARAPFTDRQVAAARAYADLTERHSAAGYGASAAFRDGAGGGDGRDGMDRLLMMRDKLDECHREIGTGIAKEVRRRRPSDRGAPGVKSRRAIFDRDLVDMVCLQGKSLRAALKARGWSVSESNLQAVHAALCAALSRLARCF